MQIIKACDVCDVTVVPETWYLGAVRILYNHTQWPLDLQEPKGKGENLFLLKVMWHVIANTMRCVFCLWWPYDQQSWLSNTYPCYLGSKLLGRNNRIQRGNREATLQPVDQKLLWLCASGEGCRMRRYKMTPAVWRRATSWAGYPGMVKIVRCLLHKSEWFVC